MGYRRDDSNSAAYGIWERLEVAFGERAVFLDDLGFKGGEDWRARTRPVLERARAVVVVIHKDWMAIAGERLVERDDPVRQELELALAREDVLICADPLYLMMAALVGWRARQRGPTGGSSLLGGLSSGRTDLALEVAKPEGRRHAGRARRPHRGTSGAPAALPRHSGGARRPDADARR